MNVGFIGLGNMGGPMAERLLAAGFSLAVRDLRPETGAGLIDSGAAWAGTARDLAGESDVVCTCVPGPVEMEAVYLGPDGILAGLRPGTVCIDHTTNDPEVVERVGAALAASVGSLLDAPLDGGREGALAGQFNLFVGGRAADLERVRPVLGPSARAIVPVGPLGAGSVAKIAHNALAMSVDLLITECLTLGVKSGVDLAGLREAFAQGCIVGGNTTFTERMPATLFRGDFDARFALHLAAKDFALARTLAEHHDVPTRLVELCHAELNEAMARGWGADDRTRASTLQEERVGVELRLVEGDAAPHPTSPD